ncbi:hypothetical protein NBRC110019_08100 [Neptunitalea chrysea]|uniref:DUF4159 domain-containing protein n=1 Tax=Neptunitalea chrysea TaxID=1647581 RepID=A0A9W6EUI6_9FLAO|nr:DUF4159 domain-containing protein [Neptunitalea chrysea]GLB51771.1 hypothetical protein NBRC110019_08100 [Neptunitalea chrysea]
MKYVVFIGMLLSSFGVFSQEIALLKYKGGGDWYGNPTSLPNLIQFCNEHIGTQIQEKPVTVEAGSVEMFEYPFIHMTGHGNVFFSEQDAENIRKYLLSGGFIHVDDNYGIKEYLERELKKVFPDKELKELPVTHPIFHQVYNFPNGLPKIHEHDGKRPQAFGLFEKDRLIFLFTYECDLGDGWENKEVHNDPENVRTKALQMGANIIKYVFEN